MAHVTFKDGQWSTVYCDKCKLSHKVLNGHIQSIYQCPYCDKVIKLTSVFVDQAVKSAKGE